MCVREKLILQFKQEWKEDQHHFVGVGSFSI